MNAREYNTTNSWNHWSSLAHIYETDFLGIGILCLWSKETLSGRVCVVETYAYVGMRGNGNVCGVSKLLSSTQKKT
jgi:hypothetical protein